MKQKIGYALIFLILAISIWVYISGKPEEWIYLLIVALLFIAALFFTEKNPFTEVIKGYKFFMVILLIVISLIGIELDHSPYYLLFIYLPALFIFHAWEERVYEKETEKAVEKAFAEKRQEDIEQALEFLAYDNRYQRHKNGPLWYYELQKMAKE